MPDMRDAIAQYLAFQGGQTPQGGMPGMGGGGMGMPGGPPWGPPAEGQPINPATGVPYPGNVDPMPPPRAPTTPGPAPDTLIPSNLQGYERLPSGQFLPGGPPPSPLGPGNTDPWQGPIPSPPVNTPMQAPMDPGVIPPGVPQAGPPAGQQIGGMDQAEWYRMYTGGR